MQKHLYLFILLLVCTALEAQENANFNLGFEKVTPGQKLPDKWMQWGVGYLVTGDTIEKNQGNRSVLLRSPQEIKNGTFGSVANTLPAIWEGKQIELRGYMKFQDVEGSAGLMLRIDGNSGMLQFDNMQSQGIRGTQDWKQYSIKLPYPSNAAKIHVGALLVGKGSLWIDQFEIFVDGKPIEQALLRKPAAALLDKEFDNGSGFTIGKLSPAQITELGNVGKLWGFLKYHHPAIASGDLNWDYELIRLLPQVAAHVSPTDKQKALHSWISKLGPIKAAGNYVVASDAVLKPELGWIKNAGFSKDVEALLDTVKNASRTEDGYYIGLQPGVGNPDFRNENAYANMPYPDAGFRLVSLFRYWNMIEYFFPYKHLIKEDWHAVLLEFIPKFVNAANETAYKLAALELITRVKDTHANVYNQSPSLDAHFGNRYAAAQLSFVEGKPVVTDFYNGKLAEQSGLKIGDVIEKINGRSVSDMIKEKLPYTAASNMPTRLRNMAPNLLRSNDSLISVRIKRNSKILDLKIPAHEKEQINLYANYNKKDTCFKLVQPDVAYLFPGKFRNDYLPIIAPEISKTKGLIIDMRCYPSEFMVFTFAPYLLPEARAFVKFSRGSIQTPGAFTFTPELKTGKTNADYYKGKVVLIVNESTLSQAEYTSMAFSQAPNITIIGSTTAAADGNVSPIVLPGNIRTGISGIGVYYPDGRETQQVGIVPDIEVKPTIQGILAGRDELLEKALEIVGTK
ncbi:S41 family peptidase [Dyadobacter sp. CY323]|uniref:S41 family peptidase n=1 Tax=Dyadobacter sp. CY323 TaxID=2907302 RepID=UPI001F1B147E|nr:S41 family peptidase [Dyadobacter sp. CY323]MCE6991426.1 S41 family peptidase [Dyadobacter sp. CY323]